MSNSTMYSDIIDLPHHTSLKRARMSNYQRAAQFSPFWALNGHEAMVKETERYVDSFTELAEDQQGILDLTLREISETINDHPYVWLTYFEPDARKPGGKYIDKSGRVFKISQEQQIISFLDGTTVSFNQLRLICFDASEEQTVY